MIYKIIDTFADKNDYLAIRVKKPNPKYLIDLLNTMDDYILKYGNYKIECFGQSYKFLDAFIFSTNLPYAVFNEKQDSVG